MDRVHNMRGPVGIPVWKASDKKPGSDSQA